MTVSRVAATSGQFAVAGRLHYLSVGTLFDMSDWMQWILLSTTYIQSQAHQLGDFIPLKSNSSSYHGATVIFTFNLAFLRVWDQYYTWLSKCNHAGCIRMQNFAMRRGQIAGNF